jgi:anaphase-promoting complex subunit 2
MQPITEHILPLTDERTSTGTFYDASSSPTHSKLRREIQTTLMQSIPSSRFFSTLSFVLFDGGCQVFHLDSATSTLNAEDGIRNTRARMTALLENLQETGLGGSMAQRAFSRAMERLMSEFIVSEYMKVDWFGRKSIIKRLYDWVQEGFAPFVADILYLLDDESRESFTLAANEVRQWQDMAVLRLGKNRVENLFDYIVNWDKSLGAILDLKVRSINPARSGLLTLLFSAGIHYNPISS